MKEPIQKPDNSVNQTFLTSLWDFWWPIILIVSVYTSIRHFVAEARYIPSGSMLPGLQINDRLVIEKLTFKNRSPQVGEIVVFRSPYSFDNELILRREGKLPSSLTCSIITFPLFSYFLGISDSACDAYIKRVVAVGGDQINVHSTGLVTLNGKLLDERYVENYCPLKADVSFCREISTTVPMDHVLVLGDNRINSWDSRYWPGGHFLPEKQIIGRAVWRFWPLNRIGVIK